MIHYEKVTWYFVEFGDCCGLYAKEGKNKCITSKDELTLIMRSLGFSPTSEELDNYYDQYGKGKDCQTRFAANVFCDFILCNLCWDSILLSK